MTQREAEKDLYNAVYRTLVYLDGGMDLYHDDGHTPLSHEQALRQLAHEVTEAAHVFAS